MSFTINKINDNEASLISYEGNEENIVIPKVIDGLEITEISSLCFIENEIVQTINIPESIKKINKNAFVGCDKLNTINYKDFFNLNIDEIIIDCKSFKPYDVFKYDLNFNDEIVINSFRIRDTERILIPNYINGIKVTKISPHSFSNFHSLKEIIFSKYINLIEESAFYGCKNLKHITFPEDLRVIRSNAFSFCTSLEYINLGDKLEYMENGAFYNCKNLKEVCLPLKFKESIFENFITCPKLKKINYI